MSQFAENLIMDEGEGLYSVERCWEAIGLSGFKVCKFALKRIANQDPPPWKANNPRTNEEGIAPTDHRNASCLPLVDCNATENNCFSSHVGNDAKLHNFTPVTKMHREIIVTTANENNVPNQVSIAKLDSESSVRSEISETSPLPYQNKKKLSVERKVDNQLKSFQKDEVIISSKALENGFVGFPQKTIQNENVTEQPSEETTELFIDSTLSFCPASVTKKEVRRKISISSPETLLNKENVLKYFDQDDDQVISGLLGSNDLNNRTLTKSNKSVDLHFIDFDKDEDKERTHTLTKKESLFYQKDSVYNISEKSSCFHFKSPENFKATCFNNSVTKKSPIETSCGINGNFLNGVPDARPRMKTMNEKYSLNARNSSSPNASNGFISLSTSKEKTSISPGTSSKAIGNQGIQKAHLIVDCEKTRTTINGNYELNNESLLLPLMCKENNIERENANKEKTTDQVRNTILQMSRDENIYAVNGKHLTPDVNFIGSTNSFESKMNESFSENFVKTTMFSPNQNSLEPTPKKELCSKLKNRSIETKKCLSSAEKKVRFSPVVYSKDIFGNISSDSFQSCKDFFGFDCDPLTFGEVFEGFDEESQHVNSEYFKHLKTSVVNKTESKTSPVPEPLSDDQSSSFNLFLCKKSKILSNMQDSSDVRTSKIKNSEIIIDKLSKVNGAPTSTKSQYSPGKRVKSSFHKRKNSSFNKDESCKSRLKPLSQIKSKLSLMENLVQQNKEKRKLYNTIVPKVESPIFKPFPDIKPCKVVLKRCDDLVSPKLTKFDKRFLGFDERFLGFVESFLGFDYVSSGLPFLGFSGIDIEIACKKSSDFSTNIEHNSILSEAGFQGWDLAKHFQGSSGLVPVGFIIDKLSEF